MIQQFLSQRDSPTKLRVPVSGYPGSPTPNISLYPNGRQEIFGCGHHPGRGIYIYNVPLKQACGLLSKGYTRTIMAVDQKWTAWGNRRQKMYRQDRVRGHFLELLGEMVGPFNLPGKNSPSGMIRGGGGNDGRMRWPFATMLERADTMEAISLNRVAPPLYGTIFIIPFHHLWDR